jgi:NADH dehydrogenase (ubiquinone) flavoprotein 1
VANVETVAVVPMIFCRGGAWLALFVLEHSQGKQLFCISGCFNYPCVIEEKLRELLERHCDAIRATSDNLLGIMPGGSSVPVIRQDICNQVRNSFLIVLPCDQCLMVELRMYLNSLKNTQTKLVTDAFIVLIKSTIIVVVTAPFAHTRIASSSASPCTDYTSSSTSTAYARPTAEAHHG